MNIKTVRNAVAEAERFLERAKEVEKKVKEYPDCDGYIFFVCKETAALKRASMDLSRALTELRRA